MAFITDNWLKGVVVRQRGHYPVQVTLEPKDASTEWERDSHVAALLVAHASNATYKTIYLNRDDLDDVLPFLIRRAEVKTKKQVAIAAIAELDDADMLAFLDEAFAKRKHLSADSAQRF